MEGKGHEFKTSPCRGCGKPIVWAHKPEGGVIPLDPRPPVYKLIHSYDEQTKQTTLRCERKLQSMVSHFATCPKANDFSRRTP